MAVQNRGGAVASVEKLGNEEDLLGKLLLLTSFANCVLLTLMLSAVVKETNVISTYCTSKYLKFCCSPNTVEVIKSGIMRWAGLVGIYGRGEKKCIQGFLVGKPKGKRPLQDLGIDGNVM
jgi:hypothetical protein